MEQNNKKITAISVISLLTVLLPWTILYVRTYDFALKSPWAEIVIGIYSLLILVFFGFSAFVYFGIKRKNAMTALAVAINGIYAVGTIALVGISIPGWFAR